MKNVLFTITLSLSSLCSAQENCAPMEVTPKTELGRELYSSYKANGFHLNSYTSWSGEFFFALGSSKNNRHFYAISEVYWGQSCRVTRKLYVFDIEKKVIGFYAGLSKSPVLEDLVNLIPTQNFYFDGEHYEWQDF